MNNFKTEADGTLVNTAPLFASVWLALFHTLRKNYNERQLASVVNTKNSRPMEKN